VEVKLKMIDKFLNQGDKIKLSMQFRGREIAYKQLGLEKFQQIMKSIEEMGGLIEADAKLVGTRILALVAPGKKK
jgi:translation initiation factor IF-3